MKRLMEKTVLRGLVTCWCLAIWPTSRSPLSVKPTTEGVVRAPMALVSTLGWSPSMMATTEFVVPRSIPMILDIAEHSFEGGRLQGARLLVRGSARPMPDVSREGSWNATCFESYTYETTANRRPRSICQTGSGT